MKSYQQKIEDYLECSGWEIISVDGDHNDWWADEIWELKSTWSPLIAKCYLSYLVDPQFDGNRKPREAIWAIGLCKNRPHTVEQARQSGCIVLDKAFKENAEDFIDKLDDVRNSNEAT